MLPYLSISYIHKYVSFFSIKIRCLQKKYRRYLGLYLKYIDYSDMINKLFLCLRTIITALHVISEILGDSSSPL